MKTVLDAAEYLSALTGCITFEYNGNNCGIDPLSRNVFVMWYGTESISVNTVNEVLSVALFDG